jgi:hypothetical protein
MRAAVRDELLAFARRLRPTETPVAFCAAARRARLLDPALAAALFG